MATSATCPKCGSPLVNGRLEGLCPKCVGLLAFDSPILPDSIEEASAPPRRLGDYDLIEEIARGGMGVVFRARQRSLNRIVAVKLLLSGQFASKQFLERFRAEAQMTARLQHPNIVPVYEVGEANGQPFFSMELVQGQNLAELVRDKPLAPDRAADYMKAIAEAVHYAHGEGILHRDLKPANVLIDGFDNPRVTDFGLAKQLQGDSELTLTGQVIGSPSFASPEQAAGLRDRVGPESDVYALGAILYYLLTGRPPFQAATVAETVHQVKNIEPVSPHSLNPAIPRDLETICLKCLAKESARRYVTAEQFAGELGRFLRGEPIHARPVTLAEKLWRWCRRHPAIAGLSSATAFLLLAVLVGSPIAIYRINTARKAEQAERERAVRNAQGETRERLRAEQTLYATRMLLTQEALAENNLGYAFELLEKYRPNGTARGPGALPVTDLRGWEWRYFWKQAQGEERFILGYHTNGVTAVGVLPDGKTAWSAGFDKAVRLWDLEGRRQIGQLDHEEEVFAATSSPDGRWLATVTSDRVQSAVPRPVRLWDLSNHVATIVASNYMPRAVMVFSPDNTLLAFQGVNKFHLFDVKARREIASLSAARPRDTFKLGLAFSPNSRTVAYCEGYSGTIILWNIERQTVVNSLKGHTDAVLALEFSPDGKRLASGGDDRTVRIWNVAQRQALIVTNQSYDIQHLVFSPDGRTLAIASLDQHVKILDADNGEPRRELHGHHGPVAGLAFLRDGRSLITGSTDSTVRVWDAIPQETPKTTQELPPVATREESRLSPDGQHLLTVFNNGTFSLWDTLKFVESQRYRLPWTNTTAWAVAPGGTLAAFGNRTGQLNVWDVPAGHERYSAPVANAIG